MSKFNYVKNFEYKVEDNIAYWHDLIDIRVPLKPSPKIILCPRIPKPLHYVNPRSILTKIDKDWWDRTRHRVYELSGFRCMCCGVKKEDQKGYPKYLDAHELYSINYSTGEVRLGYIVSLCHSMCHRGVHFGRLTSEFDKGNISEEEFLSVISHANTLCKENNLPMKNWNVDVNDNLSGNVPWNNWRLILNIEGEEKSFYSLFKSEEEMDEYYFKNNL